MISLNQLFEVKEPNYPDVHPDPKVNGIFVIQMHQANRAGLHYDIRLGHEDVLKSWASRKLPELIDDLTQKIMLFQTPDHDPSWKDFQGKIDDGYGAGYVHIWDKGTFKEIYWKKDHISVEFTGSKIKGKYTFVLYPDKKSKETQWLFFKSK
jgi:DNA ligase D-like protein (predicted 3'-phosphoesterase)